MSAWALVIGINNYHASTGLRQLHGAVADAADFADWALDPQGGGVLPEHLFFWSSPAPMNPSPNLAAFLNSPTPWPGSGPDFTRPPHASDIFRVVPNLATSAVQANAERIYVFFAGHGAQTQAQSFSEDPQNCFIAGDYYPAVPALGLVGCDDLRRFLQGVGTPELVLFFDCCRNGLPLKVPRPAIVWNLYSPNGLFVRFGIGRAAQDEAVAYEVPIDAKPPTRGAFSKLLVSGLREHRINGQLTLNDLENYVNEGIGELVRPKKQVPDFLEKPKPPNLVLAFGQPLNGMAQARLEFKTMNVGTTYVIRNHKASVVDTRKFDGNVAIVDLPIGSYSIELETGESLIVFNHLGPGVTNVII